MEEEKNESPFSEQQAVCSDAVEQLQQIVQSADAIPQAPSAPVEMQVEYAGFWVRFAALFVDGIVLAIPMTIANVVFGKQVGGFAGSILMWIYAIYMLNTRQATLGKMALGLKVISTNDEELSIGRLALREIVGKILNIFTLYIGFVMIAFTSKKQGLHDMIANTAVIYDPTGKRRPWLVLTGIIVAVGLPIMGILAGIILVSTNSARQKATDAKVKQEQIMKNIQTQSQNK